MHRFGRIIQNQKNTRYGTACFNWMPLCILQQGAVESASLTTVEKDQSSQFPDRDEDLLASLQLLANIDSTNFTARFTRGTTRFAVEKLNRLINHAELGVKFPSSLELDQLELELFTNVTDARKQQVEWERENGFDNLFDHNMVLRRSTGQPSELWKASRSCSNSICLCACD
ncbi:hypothetical protein PsorP6_010311 [Peronosclerospora sorghi]|uniref:Uncharacterized protein n=1 Tax=Peronosclerospora sorghi TaxID=230839 RepID=A0ACC0VUU9_9STRA|nr:hypothetical protein PsorP6_010311 [Peronosclerospora sorghi]